MPDRHRIRLKGPWWGEICLAKDNPNAVHNADHNAGDEAFKTTTPFRWHPQIPDGLIGTVGMTRKFNRSTGMEEAREVWLTVSSLAVPAELFLNGSAIGSFEAQSDIEIPVSSHLMPFNELRVLLSVRGVSPEVLLGEVAVEIAR